MKSKYIVLFLIISLSILTLTLRGAIEEKTYLYSEIPVSACQTTIVSYDILNGKGWSIDDFAIDIDNWTKYDHNVNSSLAVNDGLLNVTTIFEREPLSQFVLIYRNLDINVSNLPIFSINISASEGAVCHVRFLGRDSAGMEQAVWWETSPLDDMPGKSRWEIHAVDLMAFSEQAIGEIISTVKGVTIILDKPFSLSEGEKMLCVSHIRFSERNLKVTKMSANTPFFSDNEPFQAVIIELPPQYKPQGMWSIRWATVTYSLNSNFESAYRMFLLSRNDGFFLDAQGPIFLSHEASFIDIYRLDAQSNAGIPRSDQFTFIKLLLGNFSIVIIRDEWDQAGFLTFKLESVELGSSKENVRWV